MDPYSKKFLDLAERLLAQDQEPAPVLVCPMCGGRLSLITDVILMRGRQVAAMTFNCKDCGAGVALDGITPIPSWLQAES